MTRILKTIILSVVLLANGACTHIMNREIKTEVVIDAPLKSVWSILSDGSRYSEWNPFIISMEGEVASGNRLTNIMQTGPEKTMTFKPKILVAEPDRELRWIGRVLMPGIFDGEHYFQLHDEGGQTRLVHGEKFRGIGLLFISTDKFRTNFEAMNVALKERAEASVPTD